MKRIFVSLLFITLAFANANAFVSTTTSGGESSKFNPKADAFKGFLEVARHRSLFVDYVKAKPGKATVILVNGLTYSTIQWDKMTAALLAKGLGVVRFDMFGMGRTLLKYAPILEIIRYEDQVADIKSMLTKMQIPAPYNLVGLSYGGGIVEGYALKYPRDIKNMIVMAPYTQNVEEQYVWINQQIKAVRLAFPLNSATDDELADYFLRQIIYATYPSAEPIVLENPFKLEATYRLVQGISRFIPIDHALAIPAKSLHLMIAREDQYIKPEILEKYWNAVPAGSHASRIYINNTEHKMPEAIPDFAAAWVAEIVSGNSLYTQGLDFEGYPKTGEVKLGDKVIKIGDN